MTRHPTTLPNAAVEHVAHIDGLRALAVLAVIAFHLAPSALPGGLHGVDLFFVISGFVVAASAARWRTSTLAEFAGGFYRRRLLRIAPALLVCLLVTAIASMLFVPLAWLSETNDRTGLLAFFGLSNLFLAWHGDGYFAPTAEFNPYVHTWSLGVEEQFYLLFPLLFFAWLRGGRLRWLSAAAFVLVLAGSLADAMQRAAHDADAAFYLTSARLWEIAAGVLLYQLTARRSRDGWRANRLAEAAAWISLGLLLGALAWPSAGVTSILAMVAATTGLLASLHRRGAQSLLARLLALPPLVAIGRRAYSLYLWHWPVFVLLRWTLGFEAPATQLGGLLLTFVLAELSWRCIEQPLRHSSRLRSASAWPVVAGGLVSLCIAAGLAYGVLSLGPAMSLSTVTRHRADWHVLETQRLADDDACRLSAHAGGNPARREYAGVHCRGRSHTGQTLFVFGDSHAVAYTGLVTEYVLRTGATAVIYGNPGCSFGALRAEAIGSACAAQGREVLAHVGRRAKPQDILLLSSLRVPRLGDQWSTHVGNIVAEVDDPARRAAEAALASELAPLAERGVRIAFDAPKPVFGSPAFRCSDRFNAMNPVCAGGLAVARTEAEAHRAVALGSVQRVAARLPGAGVFDALPVLCDTGQCVAVRDGKPLFFDGDHLSGHANRLLLPAFIAHVDAIRSLH